MRQQSPSRGFQSSSIRQLAPYLSLGFELAVTVLFGGAIGWMLDSASGSRPWWTLVGFATGVVVAIVQFIRTVRRFDQQSRQKRNHRNSTPEHPTEGGIL